MTQEAHTPEPWEAEGFTIKRLGTKQVVARLPLDDFDYAATARRIVACVNALAGIPIEAIESGVVAELAEAARRIIDGGYVSKHIEEERADYDALTSALAKLEGASHEAI